MPLSVPPRLLAVVGTRPEGIKMLPLWQEAARRTGPSCRLLVTGQHPDLLAPVLDAFGARPDVDLGPLPPGLGLNGLLATLLVRLDAALAAEAPDLVLVHGDTTSALAGALAAFHRGIPVAHVEAGLRSFDPARPFPEEANRVAIDALAALRLAPTAEAAANLAREANRTGAVAVTGNTGVDAVLAVARRLSADPALAAQVAARHPWRDPSRRLLLVTAHRRESFGEGFARIRGALLALAARGDVQLAWPVHPNPAAQAGAAALAGHPAVALLPPLPYLEMVALLRDAAVVLTDSGGLQEEAPALGRPVLVMRDVTERPEAVACGAARLVGTDPARIVAECAALLDDAAEHARRAVPRFPYGDGQAARRCLDAVAGFLAARGAAVDAAA